jgi:hypothetical protein
MNSTNRTLLGQDAKDLPISDDEVVQRVRGGETGLFEVVMRRYNQRLYRVARAMVRDDAEAEDVMQQAYAGIESAAAFSFEAPRCERVVAAVFEQIETIAPSSDSAPA